MTPTTFHYTVERFADLELLRYKVEGFRELSLTQKLYIYYLSEAALEGRDILYDQNGKYNLRIRKFIEAIYLYYTGDKQTEAFRALEIYLKRIWFASGIHHHYSCDKFIPAFTPEDLADFAAHTPVEKLPTEGQDLADCCTELFPIIFDPKMASKRVNQADGEDLLLTSAMNYYNGVTQAEAEAFYAAQKQAGDAERPIMYGMNSTLIKQDGKLYEDVWKIGGKYSKVIERIVYWLEKATEVAENETQKEVIRLLIAFYKTGDLHIFDQYSIAWLRDTASHIDFINGFIESYGDPLGLKASWESIVNFRDTVATHRTEVLSRYAQWFEDHSPVSPQFKKEKVKGVSAKVITAAILGGDLYPASAIGINLPNSNWIRSEHGSKSVTIANLTEAYHQAAQKNGFMEAFVIDPATISLLEEYGNLTGNLHTDLHECLGHGSGKLLPGVDPDALKAYGATIEESRADLFGLYYMPDEKLIELGLTPNTEAYKSEYYQFMMNGLLTQLVRIELGKDVEESHMRNRQLIARWVLEQGATERVVELIKNEQGHTFVKINDYEKLRTLFGKLLAEIQRIKSEGDYEAARALVETYAVKIDKPLHEEILTRYKALNLAPYKGFVNPRYIPKYDADQRIVDIEISYTEGYTEQMLRYSRDYAHL